MHAICTLSDGRPSHRHRRISHRFGHVKPSLIILARITKSARDCPPGRCAQKTRLERGNARNDESRALLTDLSQLPMLLSFLPKGALRARYQLAVIAMVLHGCSGISCWRTTQYTAQLAELERDSASRLRTGGE